MVAVVVPYRAGCPHRAAAWDWIQDRYRQAHPEWEIVTGSCPPGPWVKALAIADALTRTDANRILIADADVWADSLAEAVDLLAEHPVVVPHRLVKRLDRTSTEAVFEGRSAAHRYERDPYIGQITGGLLAIRREVWDEVPMDPRFLGWGQEDQSWCDAIKTLIGRPHRLTADLIHLWHPPQPKKNQATGSAEGRALQRRYENAARDPDAMRALIAEFTEEMAA